MKFLDEKEGFNVFKNKYIFLIIISTILGAIAQPLIAYSFIKLGNILGVNYNVNIKNDLLICIAIIMIALIFAALNHIINGFVSNKISNNMRKRMFYSILNKPLHEFAQKDSGEYYNLILKKIDIWKTYYYNNILKTYESILEIIFILYILAKINIVVFILMILFIIPLAINNIIFPKRIDKMFTKYVEEDNKLLVKLKEFLLGFNYIKLNCGEKHFSQKINRYFDSSNRILQKVDFFNNLSGAFANIGVTLSQVGGTIVGIYLLSVRSITFGDFLAIFQLSSVMNEPVVNLINAIIEMKSIKNIRSEIKNELTRKAKGYSDLIENNEFKSIEFKDVDFKYNTQENHIFSKLTFKLEKDKKYLILGESGSGKSTLIKLLLNQYTNYKGEIKINDVSIKDISYDNLYKIISYIPQDIFIFDSTIKENIDLLSNHSNEEINNVIKATKLTKLINSNPLGLDGNINEEVLQVSGGEKSRIGLARALLSNKPVLILDEILSSLDKETAKEIEENILNINDKMIIHIAHKSTDELLCKYDYILKLEEKSLKIISKN